MLLSLFRNGVAEFVASVVSFEGLSAAGAVEEPDVECSLGIYPFLVGVLSLSTTSWAIDQSSSLLMCICSSYDNGVSCTNIKLGIEGK
jgi:hypothetical protein